jgi:hypothetical protein
MLIFKTVVKTTQNSRLQLLKIANYAGARRIIERQILLSRRRQITEKVEKKLAKNEYTRMSILFF